ncbi:hypothetical protein MKW92_051223 [Papaver armeniacum]|nr:hypothetical protein MKW92_051223 [Papaver armeniacum]
MGLRVLLPLNQLKKNLGQYHFTYFRVNYMTILVVVVAFSLITNPISLLVLGGLLSARVFLYLFRPSDPPLVLFGMTFTDRETLGLLSVSSVVVIFLMSVGSLLISVVLIGLGIVFAHGATRVPEIDVIDGGRMGLLCRCIFTIR